MKRLVLWGLLLFLLLGCKRNENRVDETLPAGLTVIHVDSLEERDLLTYPVRPDFKRKRPVEGGVIEVADKWPDSVEIVKLETAPECLMGAITRICVEDSLLFIGDYNQKLFVFNRSGKFKNTIGTLGRGGDELLSLKDFYIDNSRKEVVVCDVVRKKIFKYDYQGHLLGKIPFEGEVTAHFENMYPMADGNILVELDYLPETEYHYAILDKKDYRLKCYACPYPVRSKMPVRYADNIRQSCREGNCWMVTLLSDTIYRYAGGKVIPALVVKSNAKPITAEVLSRQNWETAFHARTDLLHQGYSIGLSDIWATDRFLYFSYRDTKDWYSVCWDHVARKGYKCKQYVKGNMFMPGAFLASDSDAFISSISALDFLTPPEGVGAKEMAQWKEWTAGTREDDNPILLFYHIKAEKDSGLNK